MTRNRAKTKSAASKAGHRRTDDAVESAPAPASYEEQDNGEPDAAEFELRPERKRQYTVALNAIRRLIESSGYNNWRDETTWILNIAEAAVLSTQEMEESSFPEIREAITGIILAIVAGPEIGEMPLVHRTACEIMQTVADCGFNDNAIGLTERLLDNDLDEEEATAETQRVRLWSDAFALLRGVNDLSQKQAVVLQQLYSFVDQFEDRPNEWIATSVMEILTDLPEIGASDVVLSTPMVAEPAVAAMRHIVHEKQKFADWHALNELLRAFGLDSKARATPSQFSQWTPERRRVYQHPLAKIWQGVKKGRYGPSPVRLKHARK